MAKNPLLPRPDDYDELMAELRAEHALLGDQPLLARSLETARLRAERTGRSLDELFDEDRTRLRASTYPRPDCLLPHEVERYVDRRLAHERLAHLEACDACSSLVRALAPTESEVQTLLDELRSTATATAIMAASTPSTTRLSLPSWMSRPLFEAAAATLPFAVAVIIMALIRAPELEGGIGFVASLVGIAVLAWIGAGALARLQRFSSPFWQNSLGPIVAGLCIAIAFWLYGYRMDNVTNATTTALAQRQLTDLAVRSLETRRDTGMFPKESHSFGNVVMSTVSLTPERAVYRAQGRGISGELVANVTRDQGELYWLRGANREMQARFIVGKVQQTANKFVIVQNKGETFDVHPLSGESSLWIPFKQGSDVVAVIDSSTGTASSISPLTKAAN